MWLSSLFRWLLLGFLSENSSVQNNENARSDAFAYDSCFVFRVALRLKQYFGFILHAVSIHKNIPWCVQCYKIALDPTGTSQ